MIMYRADTGYARKDHTALEIVAYETEELGNDLALVDNVKELLAGINGDRLVWLTRYEENAEKYGSVESFEVSEDSVVIGKDGSGGYLVLLV